MFAEPWGFQWPLFYSRVNLARAIPEPGRCRLMLGARAPNTRRRGLHGHGEKRGGRVEGSRDGLVGFAPVSNGMNEVIIRPHVMKSPFLISLQQLFERRCRDGDNFCN